LGEGERVVYAVPKIAYVFSLTSEFLKELGLSLRSLRRMKGEDALAFQLRY
jgi:hypothetical protein